MIIDDVINNDVMITSSGSLITVKGPSYSGLGVYSKSSTSAPTTSRLVIRYPWQQITTVTVAMEIHTRGRERLRVGSYLSVDHVGNHHDRVGCWVGEFQRQLGCLNVKRQYHRFLCMETWRMGE